MTNKTSTLHVETPDSKSSFPTYARAIGALLFAIGLLMSANQSYAHHVNRAATGLPTQTWPTGTVVSEISDGGRITTFHRGQLYLGGLTRSSVYNIAGIAPGGPAPVRLNEWALGAVGGNGHRWWKMGDLFHREYVQPEPAISSTGHHFADLSLLPDMRPWTRSAPLPITDNGLADLNYFPHIYYPWDNHDILDQRTNQRVGRFDFNNQRGHSGDITLRIGNLMFYITETPNSGLSVFDVGDPAQVRLLDVLQGPYRQYTTFYAVWRNYLVLLAGDNENSGGNNLIMIDFSDPTNLRSVAGLSTSSVTSGRYVFFQDQYGFVAAFGRAVKIDMEHVLRGEPAVVREFRHRRTEDFQVVPLGHLLMISGSQTSDDHTVFLTHQDGLDTTRPSVGYHLPVNGATRQPRTGVIALVINETLDDTTINGQTIQVRSLPGGSPIQVDVVSSQHNVINVVPKQALAANTTYEVRVVANGIHDVAGNGIEEKVFLFSTGDTLQQQRPVEITNVSSSAGPTPPAGVPMTFTVSAQAAGTLEYQWLFGDGTQTAWTSEASVSHVYPEPGHYAILVRARDNAGNMVSQVFELVVADAGADVSVAAMDRLARLRSSPIVVDGTNRRVWVVNPDSNRVALLNPDTMTRTRTISVGRRPMSVALDASARAWVVCRDNDQIRVVTAGGGTTRTLTLPRGSQPVSVVMSPDGSTAYVAEYATGLIRRFNTSTFAVTGTVAVGPTPQAMTVSSNGQRLWVARFVSGAAGGSVTPINLQTFSVDGAISLPIDTTSIENGFSARGIPNYVAGIALPPSEQRAWYVAKKDNVLRGRSRDGNALTHDTTVRTLVGRLNLVTGQETVAARIDVDDSSQPSAVALSPWGAHALVTFQGNNRLLALDARTGEEIARVNVGLAPQGVAVDPVTRRVFVQNFMSRNVTVLNGQDLMTTGARQMPVLQTVATIGSTQELLSAQVLRGKQIFYNASDPRMSLQGYTSCAVCHLDGSQDGRVWDFTDRGEGLRNTISMRGRAGTGHGRVHWSANFDEIQDFEHDIRSAFGGTGLMPDDLFNTGTRNRPLGDPKAGLSGDLDALAAYVTSLRDIGRSPHRTADGRLTAEAERGRAIFQRQSCATCHAGLTFTDSTGGLLHNIGTLKPTSGQRLGQTLTGIDTPTLLGLWDSAPYFHDGSAATLRDVLNHASASLHGRMDELTEQERNDLIAYLLQIDGSL
jgi:large repetitive protein